MPPNKRQRDEDPSDVRAREQAESIRQNILEYTEEQCLSYLGTLTTRWRVDSPPDSFQEVVTVAFNNLGGDVNDTVRADDAGSYGLKDMERVIRLHELEALTLYARMKELDLLLEEGRGAQMLKVLEVLYYSRKIVVALYRTHISYNDTMVLDEEIEESILGSWNLRFRWTGGERLKEFQKLLLYLLDVCMENRYRKQGDSIFEPLVIDGQKTYAWKRVCSIKDFIFRECQKETQFEAFIQLTSSTRLWKHMEEHLQSCADFQLPSLVKNRGFFSFRNGIYSAEDDTFFTYDEAKERVSDTIVSAKYFDLEVDPCVNGLAWDDIQTPTLDYIFEYQGFSQECIQWFMILCGRMLYDTGSRDNWQVFPYLLGLAGTGKSTIVHGVVAKLYSTEDVGVLSNNTEKTFGLAAIHDKLLFVAGECKRDFQLEQTEFQSLVSGESMAINEKYKTAYSVKWRVPGLMAGNELPSFSDNAGSIARRIVVFRFDKKVSRGDTKLEEKLKNEMAAILIKCNKAYLKASAEFGHRDVWEVIPKEFVESRDRSMAMLSLLDSFVRQSFVILDPNQVMTVREFHIAVRQYSTESGFDGPRPSQESLITSLGKFGVTMKRCVMTYRGREAMDDYLIGIGLRGDDMEERERGDGPEV